MRRGWLMVALALLALVAAGCSDTGLVSVTLITDGAHSVAAGQTWPGAVAVMGGALRVGEGARVGGAVYALAGEVAVDGVIDGPLTVLGGRVSLGPQARVNGRLTVGGGTLRQAPGATVLRQTDPPALVAPVRAASGLDWLARSLVSALALALLAALAVQVAPRPVARVTDTLVRYPVVAGALGVLVGIVAPALLVLMAFTIVLIPVTVVGTLALGATLAYGGIAWGVAVGQWLAAWRGRRAGPAAAFVGTLVFTLMAAGLARVPMVGDVIGLALTLVGLGAVLLTRFGWRTFTPSQLVDDGRWTMDNGKPPPTVNSSPPAGS